MKYGIFYLLFFVFSITALSNPKMDAYYDKLYAEEQLETLNTQNKEFKEALGHRESSMRPEIINGIGAMGIWQFMPYTLKDLGLGHITPNKFRLQPDIFPVELQEYALDLKIERDLKLLTHQWWRLDNSVNYIDKYVGKEFYGVKISLAGIIAASHIAGAGGVIKFFDSAGFYNPQDVNNTSLLHYLREFSEYGYHHRNIVKLKNEIKWLENYLNLSEGITLSSKESKLSLRVLSSKDMVTVLTLNNRVTIHLREVKTLLAYPLDLKHSYPSITEGFYHSGVLLHLGITLVCPMAMERLSGITQKSGGELWSYTRERPQLRKDIEYFNSILSPYGMLHGTLKLPTSFQYLGLKRLRNYSQLGVG